MREIPAGWVSHHTWLNPRAIPVNFYQRIILGLTAAALLTVTVFPPWLFEGYFWGHLTKVPLTRIPSDLIGRIRIDYETLLMEWAALLITGTILCFAASRGKAPVTADDATLVAREAPVESDLAPENRAAPEGTASPAIAREYIEAALADPSTPDFMKEKLSQDYGIPYARPVVSAGKQFLRVIGTVMLVAVVLVVAILARELARAVFL